MNSVFIATVILWAGTLSSFSWYPISCEETAKDFNPLQTITSCKLEKDFGAYHIEQELKEDFFGITVRKRF